MFWRRNAEQNKDLQNTLQEQENLIQEQDITSYIERIKELEFQIHLLSELLKIHNIDIPAKVKDDVGLQILEPEHYIYNELYVIKQLIFKTNNLFIKMFFENKK